MIPQLIPIVAMTITSLVMTSIQTIITATATQSLHINTNNPYQMGMLAPGAPPPCLMRLWQGSHLPAEPWGGSCHPSPPPSPTRTRVSTVWGSPSQPLVLTAWASLHGRTVTIRDRNHLTVCEVAPLTCSTTLAIQGSSTPPSLTTLVGTTRGLTHTSTTVRGIVWQAWLVTAVVIHIMDHRGAAMLMLPLLPMLGHHERAMLPHPHLI